MLYITQEGLYLHHELDVLKVKKGDDTIFKIPFHHLEGITIFGICGISPSLLQKCLEKGIFISYLTARGKFQGRLEGSNSGNVLIRKAQFKKSEIEKFRLEIARSIVAGKLQNCRSVLSRTARESKNELEKQDIKEAIGKIEKNISLLEKAESIESIRGYEGASVKTYFSVFDYCIIQQKEDFQFHQRTRRPPRSRTNALLSFLYSLLTNDCIAVCQAVGLDPYIGFLHDERPGRPSLALDMMEEFRPFIDRLVFTLINRKQIQVSDFLEKPGSVFFINDDSRKELIKSYQERKKEEIFHPWLNIKSTVGELPYLQARIFARTLRGDLKYYIPFIWK
ncbi:type I-C CRISPR-associated endonuclease Cas1c [Leptospira interrogans]|uniref:type I-C CRISPR-associated endonuclease Cas1c n=1 Tax=Leptospira interrogans TaxID=173 RepID=UPI0021592CF1|nr:type I-C CRISPR-associated endonuclease Cas1c [Leptospira interrogans]